jgi:hypothetical protein
VTAAREAGCMSLEPIDLIGVVASVYGVGGALSILLQARQMLARRASCDVSLRFLGVYVGAMRSGCCTG